MMEATFLFTIGDWSNDGHEKKETYILSSNTSMVKLVDIHGRIVPKLNIALSSWCEDYDDHFLKEEQWKQLEKLGFSFNDDLFENSEEGVEYNLFWNPDEFLRIWIFLMKCVCPDLSIEILEYPKLHELLPYSFGYGLFGE